jgi:nucleotide-binding universal stress UspA family protein
MILPEVKIKRILYTTDLSDSARYALAYAMSLANAYGAKLDILHVLADDPDMNAGIVGYVGEDRWLEIQKRNESEARSALIGKKRDNVAIREVLDIFTREVQENIGEHEVAMDETIVLRGKPVDVIVKTAEERNCDLIVMGSYGHGGLAGAIMGSTAQRVLRRSRKPVLVVHLPEGGGRV